MEREMTSSCCGSTCDCTTILDAWVIGTHLNSLTYDAALCVNCEMCLTVCPHDVFEAGARVVALVHPESCMECGACERNCPTGALEVDSGVGCAAAMIQAALTGSDEVTCGPGNGGSCCAGSQGPSPQFGPAARAQSVRAQRSCCGEAAACCEDESCGDEGCCAASDCSEGGCCGDEGGCCGDESGCCGDESGCCGDESGCCGDEGGCCGDVGG
jgi:NAD-dependent dihydropyrimidine dehydrogenase PreA subunit